MTNTFDAETHTYTINGRVVPGVTEILGDTGLRELFFDAEHAADKGTKVHLACHYEKKGTLNPATVSKAIQPYVHAFQQWMFDCRAETIESEYMIFNEPLQYGTILDGLHEFEFMGELVKGIVEIKSGQPQDSDCLQTAGQLMALDTVPRWKGINRRFVLYLKDNGTCKLVENTDASDFADFEAACRVYHRKRRT